MKTLLLRIVLLTFSISNFSSSDTYSRVRSSNGRLLDRTVWLCQNNRKCPVGSTVQSWDFKAELSASTLSSIRLHRGKLFLGSPSTPLWSASLHFRARLRIRIRSFVPHSRYSSNNWLDEERECCVTRENVRKATRMEPRSVNSSMGAVQFDLRLRDCVRILLTHSMLAFVRPKMK